MNFKKYCGVVLVFALSGCASLSSVSLTQIPEQRENVVSASVSKTIFLGFNSNNDFVSMLPVQLNQQCVGGKVEGILTKSENIVYPFFHKKVVTATGFCVR